MFDLSSLTSMGSVGGMNPLGKIASSWVGAAEGLYNGWKKRDDIKRNNRLLENNIQFTQRDMEREANRNTMIANQMFARGNKDAYGSIQGMYNDRFNTINTVGNQQINQYRQQLQDPGSKWNILAESFKQSMIPLVGGMIKSDLTNNNKSSSSSGTPQFDFGNIVKDVYFMNNNKVEKKPWDNGYGFGSNLQPKPTPWTFNNNKIQARY